MRFLVITAGSHGDVHPYIGVARALAARGHVIDFLVHPHFHEDVRAAGLNPLPLTPNFDVQGVLKNPDLMHSRKGGRVVMEMVFESIPEACATINAIIQNRRPDAVLAHLVCIGSRWICEREGVPIAIGSLSPLYWFSRHAPVPALQKAPGRIRELVARLLFPVFIPLVRFISDRRINAIRASLGFPPERGALLKEFNGGDITLGLWSPALRGPLPDDPPHGSICGFPWFDGSTVTPALDPRIEEFLQAGEPPIVFCLGTAASHTAGDFHSIAATAVGRMQRRGILLVGKGVPMPASLPAGVIAAEYAPFSLLLPRASVVVHHGGVGSTGQTLRAGRPTLVIPHAHDQFNNALLAHRLGIARILPRTRVSVSRLADELAPLLEDPSYDRAAQDFARHLQDEDGANIAADHMEALARQRKPKGATAPALETLPSRR